MKKVISTLLAAAAIVPLLANPMPDAEAKKYLKTLAEKGKNYQRRADKTYFFSRAQLKYGLERNDYLRRWCDRPLMQESGFARAGTFEVSNSGSYSEKGFINRKTFIAESNLLEKYNFAGFAFFPELTGRPDIYNHIGKPGTGKIVLLPEFFFQFKELTEDEIETRMKVAERALNNPHVLRINGKIVITSYPCTMDNGLPFWIKLKADLTKKFGDKFIIMPWMPLDYGMRPTGKNKTWSKNDIVKMENRLRTFLRALDGFYYNTPPFFNRRYHWEFDREVAIPIIHSVMSEDEFKGKFLAWGTKVGHMNCHVQSFGVDAFNTDTLRGSVGAAVLAKADIVNCVEWDEENENTSFRPMTMTGFSTLRICRAFEQLANSGKFSPLPGDDLSIPNLMLSYPRVLAAGQLIEMEVANIPDGSGKAPATVSVGFRDNNGKVVWSSATRKIAHDSICAEVFTVESEKLLKYRFLNPFIIVNGKEWKDGFYPVEIRAWWHWDYLYAKHVLRDMPQNVTAQMSFAKPDKHGLTNITVKVSSPEKIRSIEVISGDNLVIYSHDNDGGSKFRESADRAAFRISLQGIPKSPLHLTGSVKLLNMPEMDIYPLPGKTSWRGSKYEWTLKNRHANIRPIHRFISIPRKDLDKAAVEIDLPGLTREKTVIRLADVQKLGSFGINGAHSSHFIIVRNNQQEQMPDVLGGKEYEFTFAARPDLPEAGFLVQVIDQDYRIYRSKKVSPFVPSGKKVKLNVFSTGKNERATVDVDADFVKPVTYDFSAKQGSVLSCSVGSRWDGVLSGFVPMATGFGQGETQYGSSMTNYFSRQKSVWSTDKLTGGDIADATPKREVIDGKNTLVFNGAQYASLPMGIVPPFGSYEIEMEIYVEKNGAAKQTILTGTRDSFTLMLDNRVPTVMNYCNQLTEVYRGNPMKIATGPRLHPWKWNKLKIRFDQDKLTVITNGVAGTPVAVSGYHRYPRATAFGASERGEFFTGKIRSFVIRPF